MRSSTYRPSVPFLIRGAIVLLLVIIAGGLLVVPAGFGPEPGQASANPLTDVATVAAGERYTCAVTTASSVKCWGRNNRAQLGDGTTTWRTTPVDVCGDATCTTNLSGVVSVATGVLHTCAVTSAGTVKCWGYNSGGRLGDGTTTWRPTPVDVCGDATCTTNLSGVTAIALSPSHTCALTATGGVKCWGDNSYGALGDGTTTGRTTPVDVCGDATCTTNLSGVTSIAAGGDGVGSGTCAVITAGTVKCWGYNNSGQVGDGTTGTDRITPVNVCANASCINNLTDVATVAFAGPRTCVVTTAGAVKCWGYNFFGSLGDGTSTQSTTPVDVCGDATCTTNLSGVTAVVAAYGHTCAVITMGGLKCWGYNSAGQLGDGTVTMRSTPVDVVGLGSVASATAGGSYAMYDHTCAVTTTGGVKCWGATCSARWVTGRKTAVRRQ